MRSDGEMVYDPGPRPIPRVAVGTARALVTEAAKGLAKRGLLHPEARTRLRSAWHACGWGVAGEAAATDQRPLPGI